MTKDDITCAAHRLNVTVLSDLCMMYKIVFGLCDVDTDNLYILSLDVNWPTRGHCFKIMLEHGTNNYHKKTFLYSV